MVRGYILWEGPHPLTGHPMVCIATMRSKNAKNGALIQTWILRADLPPTARAARTDMCLLCPFADDGCYVSFTRAPLSVWKAFHRGVYSRVSADMHELAGRLVRIGAAGDPAFVPRYVWDDVARVAAGVVGYTHQSAAMGYAAWGMVSCESETQARAAWAQGRRTFRVLAPGQLPAAGEVMCPSDRGVSCDKCMLCDPRKRAKSLCIPAHGFQAKAAVRHIASLAVPQ